MEGAVIPCFDCQAPTLLGDLTADWGLCPTCAETSEGDRQCPGCGGLGRLLLLRCDHTRGICDCPADTVSCATCDGKGAV